MIALTVMDSTLHVVFSLSFTICVCCSQAVIQAQLLGNGFKLFAQHTFVKTSTNVENRLPKSRLVNLKTAEPEAAVETDCMCSLVCSTVLHNTHFATAHDEQADDDDKLISSRVLNLPNV